MYFYIKKSIPSASSWKIGPKERKRVISSDVWVEVWIFWRPSSKGKSLWKNWWPEMGRTVTLNLIWTLLLTNRTWLKFDKHIRYAGTACRPWLKEVFIRIRLDYRKIFVNLAQKAKTSKETWSSISPISIILKISLKKIFWWTLKPMYILSQWEYESICVLPYVSRYVQDQPVPDALANNKENNNCGEDEARFFTSLFEKRKLAP